MTQASTNETFHIQTNQHQNEDVTDANSVEFRNGEPPNFATNAKRIWIDQPDEAAYFTVDGSSIIELARKNMLPFVNVQDHPFNARGNGTTDDTAAIQAAINYAIPLGLRLVFPSTPNSYKITGVINIPFGTGWSIEGASRGSVTIKQFTNNTPIFRFTTADTHSWVIQGITFDYNVQQPAVNTLAIPLYFALDSGVGGSGYYNWQVTDCTFKNCYYGVSQRTDSQQIALWGIHFRDCWFEKTITGGAIYLIPAPAVGQPSIKLEKLYINCRDMTSTALFVSYCDSLFLDSVEFNSGTTSTSSQMQISGSNVVLINCRSEALAISGVNSKVWNFPMSNVTAINCEVTGLTVAAGSSVTAMFAGSGGRMTVQSLNVGGTVGGGGSCSAVYADTLFSVEQVTVTGSGFTRINSASIPKLDVDFAQGNRSKLNGDVNVVLTVTSEPVQVMYVNQTANRTVTLPSTGLYDGLEFSVVKYNTSAFTVGIIDPVTGKNITIPSATKASVKYRALGANEWMPVDYATLP